MKDSAGLHVTMDAYVRDSKVFTRSMINELFEKLVAALDMKNASPAANF